MERLATTYNTARGSAHSVRYKVYKMCGPKALGSASDGGPRLAGASHTSVRSSRAPKQWRRRRRKRRRKRTRSVVVVSERGPAVLSCRSADDGVRAHPFVRCLMQAAGTVGSSGRHSSERLDGPTLHGPPQRGSSERTGGSEPGERMGLDSDTMHRPPAELRRWQVSAKHCDRRLPYGPVLSCRSRSLYYTSPAAVLRCAHAAVLACGPPAYASARTALPP